MTITRRSFLAASSAVAVGALLGADATTQPAMLTRAIPSSGQRVPAVGMGTWQTFDEQASDDKAMARLSEVLKIFHAAGGRVIDSSPMYGRSEEVTGTLSTRLGINDELFITTKVWTRGEQAGIEQMRDSMQKLGRTKLELMQIHNLIDWQTHIKTLRDWKANGTFRHIGVTHYLNSSFDELERIIKSEKIDFVQLPYSLDSRQAEKSLIPTARDHGVAILVMRPFGGGGLFLKVRGKPLPEHAASYAKSWAQAFLKFVLSNPAITAALPATSKPEHMRDNIGAGFGPLPDAKQREALIVAI